MTDVGDNSTVDLDNVTRVLVFYNEAVTGNQEWRNMALQCRDFHSGNQWTASDRQALERSGKPALTINRIRPTIGFISGQQRQNRKDIRILPLRNSSEAAATALTELVEQAMKTTNADYEQAEQFVDGTIDGKGWLYVGIADDDQDLNGRRITIESLSSFHVYEDPTADEYDINATGKFIIREHWMDIDECQARWPQANGESLNDRLGLLNGSWIDKLADTLLRHGDRLSFDAADDESRRTMRDKYRLRVLECWWKNYQTVGMSTDKEAGSIIRLLKPGEMAKAKALAESKPDQYTYREQVTGVLCKTTIIGATEIEHVVDPFDGIDTFPFFRYTPYFATGRAGSVVDALLSPQEEENKRRSQALHHLNQSANSGWLVGKISTAYKAILQSFGSKPGVVVELDQCGGKAERLNPAPISQGHMDLAQAAANDIKEISGVANMVGYDSQAKESGLALGMRQRQGMTILEEVYDRFDYTCQLFGKFIVELIRRDMGGKPIYSDEEIIKILDWDEVITKEVMQSVLPAAMQEAQRQMPPPPPQPAQQPQDGQDAGSSPEDQYQQALAMKAGQIAQEMAQKAVIADIRNIATGRYSVQVSQSPNAPTAKMAAFMELTEIAKMYPGIIPPEIMIGASDIRDKDKIIDSIDAQQEEQAKKAQVVDAKMQQAQPILSIAAKV